MSPNEGGLGLFDDAASAVGNFPTALRGYDRSAVDDYVRSLESAVVQTRRRASGLDQQVRALQDQVNELTEKQKAQELDYTNLGGRASDILRLAEEQAREVIDQASVDAERMKEEARRDADQARDDATRAGRDITSHGVAEIDQLRARGQQDIRLEVEKARAEAEAIVAAARRQAESLQRAAEHESQTVRQNAYLDTETLRRTAEREVADIRQEIAAEREAAIGHLREVHEDAVAKTSALLGEANEHHQQAVVRLDTDIVEAARIRSEAQAEAERVRVQAAQDAEDRIVAARKQAAAITDRTQQEFAWRKQQLRRETELLGQRKQAVLNQLASLSALAEQTAQSFPEMDELEGFDAEETNDRTVMMPPSLAPALPPRQGQPSSTSGTAAGASAPQEAGSPADADESVPAAGDETQPTPKGNAAGGDESSAETRVLEAVRDPGQSDPASSRAQGGEDTMEIDGDATVMVPASQLPAGTAHLRGGSSDDKS